MSLESIMLYYIILQIDGDIDSNIHPKNKLGTFIQKKTYLDKIALLIYMSEH